MKADFVEVLNDGLLAGCRRQGVANEKNNKITR